MTVTPIPSSSSNQTVSLTSGGTRSLDECDFSEQPSTSQSTDSTGGPDDDVQFIFSAPRRKKKIRRRAESTRVSPENTPILSQIGGCSISAIAVKVPRRGTTGMVQRLGSCHLGDVEGSPSPALTRSGSLPVTTSTVINSCAPLPASTSTQPRASILPLQHLPIPTQMFVPKEACASKKVADIASVQSTSSSSQVEDEASENYQTEELEQSTSSSFEPSQNNQLPTPSNSRMDEVQIGPFEVAGNAPRDSVTSMSDETMSPSFTDGFNWKPIPNPIRNQPLALTSCIPAIPCGPNLDQNSPWSQFPWASLHASPQQQTVTVPARLVPEQSVSPRTRTIEIPRQPHPNQFPARQMLYQRAMQYPNRQGLPFSSTSGSMVPMNHILHSQIPRPDSQRYPVQGLYEPQQTSFLQSHVVSTNPSDVLRRPSLYKVPAWTPPFPPISSLFNRTSPSQGPSINPSIRNSNLSTTTTKPQEIDASKPRQGNTSSPDQGTGTRHPGPIHGMVPMILPRAPPTSHPTQFSAPSSSAQSQANPNKRKHSPNLVVDIAEACQQNFPFSLIAERHQVPIQKVFDTFSAIIQLPLLRSASADKRRHGSLGKRRLKEFKDARKAMDDAMRENDDGGNSRARKMQKKGEQPLIRAAIRNCASRARGVGS